ncbi:hypothetical protein D3C85_851160 [compost metagenome]
MRHHQVVEQALAGGLVIEALIPRQHKALPHIVDQLRQQHRGHLVAVVLGAEALIADIEPLLGTEQRLKEEVAVIIAAGAIPAPRRHSHQIEPHGGQGARVDAVVHAEQADLLEGDGAHRHQGAEVDLTGEEALAGAGLPQHAAEVILQQICGDGLLEARFPELSLPLGQLAANELELTLFLLVGQIEALQQRQQAGVPLCQWLRLLQPGQKLSQRIDKPGELAERQALLAFDISVGKDARHRFPIPHGKTEQHAAQAEQPAVAGHGRQIETDGVAVIQPPADAGLLHPDPQLVELVVIQLEAAQHGGHLENGEQLPRPQASVGQPEQGEEALQQRALLTRRPIRDRKRDLPPRAKHRLNVGAVAVHIRHHHHHIFRGEGGILFEQRQQPVVQHFQLAHRAVTGVDLQGSIRRIDRALVMTAVEIELTGAPFCQLQHILLDGAQQADIAFAIHLVDIDEGLDLRHLQLHQLVQVVAPQLAHGGEQRVGGALQRLDIGAGFELVLQPSQGLAIQQIPPVVAAGVGDEQVYLHLGSATEGQQGLHITGRQRRDAEHEHPLRQLAR